METARKFPISSEEFIRTMDVTVAATILLKDGKYFAVNDSAVELFGVGSKQELVGLAPYDESLSIPNQPRGGAQRAAEKLIKTAESGEPVTFEWIHKHGPNQQVYTKIRLSKIVLSDGEFVLAVLTDITSEKKANEMFKQIFDFAPDGMYLLDSEGRFVDANPMAERITGMEKETALGSRFSDIGILSDMQLQKALENFQDTLSKGNAKTVEYVLSLPDGSEKNVEIRTQLFYMLDEPYVLGIIRDLTEVRRITDQAILNVFETEQKFTLAFENNPSGMMIWEKNGAGDWKVSRTNSKAQDILKSVNIDPIHSVAAKELVPDIYNEIATELESIPIEQSLQKILPISENNINSVLSITAYKISAASATIIIADITEEIARTKQVEQLNNLRSRFIGVVSHNMRTPLNSISWNLENILNEEFGPLNPALKSILSTIKKANSDVISQIGNLVIAMDIEQGLAHISFGENVIFDSIVKAAVSKYKKVADKKNVELLLEIRGRIPTVRGDAKTLREAIESILDNAVMYTTKGEIKVLVFFDGQQNHLHFEVDDTGIGIPGAEQYGIFERFFRASNAIALEPNGLGLSLSICKYYVEKHKGSIGFNSEEDLGTKFWIDLPIDQTNLDQNFLQHPNIQSA